jgi:uncharacterized protein (TIGR03437 family)
MIAFSAGLVAQTAETIAFRAILSPANEVPAITLGASGAGTVLLHVVRDSSGKVISATTDFTATYQFPGEVTFTGMHIHKGVAGENGPVTINSGISGTATVPDPTGRGTLIRQGFTASTDTAGLDTVNGMLTNPAGFYFNVHTTVNPGGVIRGQLQRADMIVLMGLMSPANEVPPTDSAASGIASVIVLATRDSNGTLTSGLVTFDVNYTGFADPTTFTGFHIHQGPAGANGPVTINTGINGTTNPVTATPGGGNLHYDVEVNIASAASVETLNTLFSNPAGAYINLHTTVFPGGVIRDQLRRTDKIAFPVSMLPANEIPAITGLDASAPANVNAYTIRNPAGQVVGGTVIFDVNPRFPGTVTFTGLHIHNGKATENGAVTINTGLSATNSVVSSTGSGNIYRVVNVNSEAGFATLNSMVQNPENHYVNLHSTVNPGGVVRSQLAAANAELPKVTAIISAVSDSSLTTVAPGGLMTIFGTNLIKVPADVQTSPPGGTLPVSYNGTQVTVGGKNAPLLVVARDYMVVQVPTDAVPGTPDVIVKNSNGVAPTRKTTVAAVAPALFFDASGGVFLKNSDFTLVGSRNPAKASDIVLIYSTGLGAITGLVTGQATPLPTGGSGFFNTAPVTVTVGGKDAPVIYSLASPGFVGLYQTAITIPAAAGTGNVPVVVKSGTAISNTVNIFLQ